MPAEGLPWLAREELLTGPEIERLVRLLVRLGIREVKLTGGEPTVRGDLVEIVRRLRAVDPPLELSLTSNGYLLDRVARPLADAGLDRVTVSCDSLQRHRFAEMTRRDALDAVLAGIRAAAEAGLEPVKVNCVVMGGVNDEEVVAFARLARSTGHEVRFIEFMPLDAERRWERSSVVPSSSLLERIQAEHPMIPDGGGGPARVYRFADGSPGRVGFVSSVTEPFCERCDRLRLTADGQLRACLFSLEERDLRGPMRAGADDDELEEMIRTSVAAKWAGHRIGRDDFVRPARSMSMIGG
jgi:cyclic pyranopterin phosphate synthase